jgi:surfactin synthase thioesterase subunit
VALPPLHADLALVARYKPRPGTVRVPLTAFAGADDETAAVEDVRRWSDCSTRWRGIHVLPGGHFFVSSAGRAILDAVAATFASA